MWFNEEICEPLKMQIFISHFAHAFRRQPAEFFISEKICKMKAWKWNSTNPVKILQYPVPKYKSLITSRTSEILTLGEKSSANLGSEAIIKRSENRWKIQKNIRIRKKLKSRRRVRLSFLRFAILDVFLPNLITKSQHWYKLNF